MREGRVRLKDCPLLRIKTHVLCLIFENIELELSPSRPWFSQAYDFNAPSCDVERLSYFQPQSMSHDRLVSFVLRQQYLDCMLFPWWDFLCSPPWNFSSTSSFTERNLAKSFSISTILTPTSCTHTDTTSCTAFKR